MSKFELAYFVDSYSLIVGETDFQTVFRIDHFKRVVIYKLDTINGAEISLDFRLRLNFWNSFELYFPNYNSDIITSELKRRIFRNKLDALEFLYNQPAKCYNIEIFPNLRSKYSHDYHFTICNNFLYYLMKTNKCIYYFKIWNNIDLLKCLLRYFCEIKK